MLFVEIGVTLYSRMLATGDLLHFCTFLCISNNGFLFLSNFGKVLKCGPSNNWKVVDTLYFQNYGKLIKLFGNMTFPIPFQRLEVIGNANIFCSDGLLLTSLL